MRTDYTVKELFEKAVDPDNVDIITVHKGTMVQQCDNKESIVLLFNEKVRDYEVDYYTDDGLVYLDIYL